MSVYWAWLYAGLTGDMVQLGTTGDTEEVQQGGEQRAEPQ